MTQGIINKKKAIQQKLKERSNKPVPSKKPKNFKKQKTLRKNKKVVGVQQIENLLSGAAVSANEHMKYLANKLK
ncbi:uncharacterized protein cubi_02366 [Cryptosporidium ubiquitum]|uniref:Uncharacterized protein n=1 Tax=Cryptosporidium ubiquitum TaxID=857276 RepID=A0A1J4MGJ5_9CRYT|nr:uncharacterized protein cubi_02366 [Cryptosporidium ubiquitum]OII73135.1 hypothetical protein cubi_02366 [Cryptosporidium ubiquitum]